MIDRRQKWYDARALRNAPAFTLTALLIQAVNQPRPLDETLRRRCRNHRPGARRTSVARPRLLAWLLGAFGSIGLTLGTRGIFGGRNTDWRRRWLPARRALAIDPMSALRSD